MRIHEYITRERWIDIERDPSYAVQFALHKMGKFNPENFFNLIQYINLDTIKRYLDSYYSINILYNEDNRIIKVY